MEKNKKEIREELEKLAPSLSKLKKEEHFEVPENYFQQLPDDILKQIDFGKNQTFTKATPAPNWLDVLVEKISFLFQPRVAIGFGVVVILLASTFLLNQSIIDSPTEGFAEISETEIEDYLKANLDDFEEEALYDFVDEVAANDLMNEIQEEDLDNYMDEIIDDLEEEDLEDFL